MARRTSRHRSSGRAPALSVIAYERVRQRDPELASAAMRRTHQLAALVVIITSGIEKAFEALQTDSRPPPAYPSRSYRPSPAWSYDGDFDRDSA